MSPFFDKSPPFQAHTYKAKEISMTDSFNRQNDNKIDVKKFDRSTVSTLLIPKNLSEKLYLAIPCGTDPDTGKVLWDFRIGLSWVFSPTVVV
jgi:hypothetical protein